MKCWEFKKCGREQGGKNASISGVCPAYPDYGDCCAPVAGTMCSGMVQGSYAKKLDSCVKCEFYNSLYYNKGKTSEVMHKMWEK